MRNFSHGGSFAVKFFVAELCLDRKDRGQSAALPFRSCFKPDRGDRLGNHRFAEEEGILLFVVRRGGGTAFAAQLSTLHGAKGLEFPVVFLCGADENMLPLSVGGKTDKEEERRLFYVGMTRAKEELVLCCGNRPSPFLAELPANVKRENAETAKYKQMTLF